MSLTFEQTNHQPRPSHLVFRQSDRDYCGMVAKYDEGWFYATSGQYTHLSLADLEQLAAFLRELEGKK